MKSESTNWFEDWFNDEYISIYSHRDNDEAVAFVGFLSEHLKRISTISTVSRRLLDIACGGGRHAAEFLARGWDVIGIDLSNALLASATTNYPSLKTVRADMRSLPFPDRYFDATVNLFTSFGYFTSDVEHQNLLVEWSRILKPQGILVMDYLNPTYVIQNLVPEDKKIVNGLEVVQSRRISADGRRVEKDITITGTDGKKSYYKESVALYDKGQLQNFMELAGLTVVETWGNYEGNKFVSGSPRTILFATRDS